MPPKAELSLAGRDVTSLEDLTVAEIGGLARLAAAMAEAIGFGVPGGTRAPADPLDRILGLLFYEPSTRTRLSFEAAMLRLGGSCVGFAEPGASSVAKGESLADTARIVSGYADALVVRHPLAGIHSLAVQLCTSRSTWPCLPGWQELMASPANQRLERAQ